MIALAKKATVRQDGERVILILGDTAAEMPWEAAEAIGKALIAKARLAEELAKADAVALDSAILLRAGFGNLGIGLAKDSRVRKEAIKLADGDRNLRRYMPGGIKSKEEFGSPTIIRGPAPKTQGVKQ